MTKDVIVHHTWTIIPDPRSDGFFWRNGERWLRERGIETRILDVAPNLEKSAPLMPWDVDAREVSKEPK